jgi:hypothetical protein
LQQPSTPKQQRLTSKLKKQKSCRSWRKRSGVLHPHLLICSEHKLVANLLINKCETGCYLLLLVPLFTGHVTLTQKTAQDLLKVS